MAFAPEGRNAPEQIRAQEFPLAVRMHELIVDRGYRAIWVMVDQGVQEPAKDPTCYELERKHLWRDFQGKQSVNSEL